MFSATSTAAGPPPKLMEDSDSDWDMSTEGEGDSEKPWLAEFNHYLNTHDVLPEGMTVVKWWGVCNFLILFHLCSFFLYIVELCSLPSLGISRKRLSFNNGILCVERACILVCRNYIEQMPQPTSGWHCWSIAIYEMHFSIWSHIPGGTYSWRRGNYIRSCST